MANKREFGKSVHITKELHLKLRKRALKDDVSLKEIVDTALTHYLHCKGVQ